MINLVLHTLFLFLLTIPIVSQDNFPKFKMNCIEKFDTVIDYKTRFYKDDTLITKNLFLDFSKLKNGDTISRSSYGQLKQGPWIEYLDKNLNLSEKGKSKYFRLIEYEAGKQINKTYYFTKKGKLLYSILGFPIYESSTFNGIRKIVYRKNLNLKSISYEKFTDDSLYFDYYNHTEFFRNNNRKATLFRDDSTEEYKSIKYDKKGRIVSLFSKHNGLSRRYTMNYKRNIRKTYNHLNNKLHISTYKNGKLIREKIK